MNKKTLSWIIGFICVSLAGIIFIQYIWIRNAIEIKEAQFDRSVNDALGMVVNKIETRENVNFLSKNLVGDSMRMVIQAFARDTILSSTAKIDSLIAVEDYYSRPPKQGNSRNKGRINPPGNYLSDYQRQKRFMDSIMNEMGIQMISPEELMFNVEFSWNDQDLERLDSLVHIREFSFSSSGAEFPADENGYDEREIIIQKPDRSFQQYYKFSVNPDPASRQRTKHRKPFSPSPSQIQERLKNLTNKTKKLQEVIKKMAIEIETDTKPLTERIEKKKLEKILVNSLSDKDITLPFEFAVQSVQNDTIPFPVKSAGFTNTFSGTIYRTSLFPNDVFQKPEFLLVYFPQKQSHLLESLSLVMIGSIFFTFIIILSSALSIYVMIRQKKISDIKTDFINNMTHEFKTPIATISIAADSITNQKVLQEPETIRNFTRIIKEENNRMNSRVEQILQMSLIDSKDFRLKPVIVNMHVMIEKAVSQFKLQIEKRNGNISIDLKAVNSIVEVDEDYLRNVLINLLDNATKYSLSNPEIKVFTFNRSGKFCFGVEDKGIGMSQETQRKVFDKFFRITTGNIHNIKGFGLGLSFVKAIVLAHRGSIQVTSEVGKGSRFEISLPVVEKDMNHEQAG